MNYAVSATVGLVCLIASVLLWTIGNRMLPRLTVLLILTGVAGLTSTWAGRQAGGAIGTANGVLDGVTVDLFGARVSSFVAFILAFIVGVQLYRKQVGTLTLFAAALLPIAVRGATGDMGSALANVVAGIARFVGGLVATLTGTQ